MLRIGVMAFAVAALVSCEREGDRFKSPPDEELSIDERFFAARTAKCEEYGSLDGFIPVSMKRVKDVLSYRHDGERLSAYFQPEHYCAAMKQKGERTCYRFFPSSIPPGGGINFCVDRQGRVSDFTLTE